MKYYCTKCNCGYSTDKFEKKSSMTLFRCEKCKQVVIVIDDKDVQNMNQFLLNEQELDYMLHLVRKQKEKLTQAYKQLDVTEQKLIIQQELMEEIK